MVTVSRAPLETLQAFRQRIGWSFKWVSSLHNDFNQDYHVTFTADQVQIKQMFYNYTTQGFPVAEAPGISIFRKDNDGAIYHTYSSYSRGLDMVLGVYHLLDIVPKGRDEENLK